LALNSVYFESDLSMGFLKSIQIQNMTLIYET